MLTPRLYHVPATSQPGLSDSKIGFVSFAGCEVLMSFDSLLGCCSNPVTGQSKFKRALHSKPSEKRMPIEICFLCNSQHLHGVQLGPHTKPR